MSVVEIVMWVAGVVIVLGVVVLVLLGLAFIAMVYGSDV